MTTTVLSTEIDVSVEPLFTEGERITLAGFLAGYSGLTRDSYALDLRMFTVVNWWLPLRGSGCWHSPCRLRRRQEGEGR